ncbi:MAG TPA: universal stress protein [Solirubrobacterales bacterium]|nr:universal stress protein [Solirubrobacterales bacterium]
MEPGSTVAEPVAPRAIAPPVPSARPLRLLVGYDGRPASRDALAFAKALTATQDGGLTVASVRGYWPELLGESYELVVKEDEHWIRRGATEVLGDTPFSVRVLTGGHETTGLKELAEAEESDMIVVGSTHRGRLGRVCPGSAGERVLSEAPCAVAVAPRGLADRSFRIGTIAVGFDGSKQSQVALRTAIDLAERAGASLRIISVVDVDLVLATEGDPRSEDEKARIERRLMHAVEHARSSVEAEGELLYGSPSHAIPDAAAGADLLVIGSRGHYGAARRLLLGSVAARVTRTAPCPTLITPITPASELVPQPAPVHSPPRAER